MLKEWLGDRLCRKYELQLLTRRIRLWDVPETCGGTQHMQGGFTLQAFELTAWYPGSAMKMTC